MDSQKRKKPLFRRWWFWLIAAFVAFVVLIIIAVAVGGGNQPPASSGGTPQTAAPPSQQPSSASPAASPEAAPAASPAASPSASPAATPSPSAGARSVEMQLKSGNYTAGTDFPAGVYDIAAVSGSGNVSSDNLYSGGINAMMGSEEANKAAGSDLYEQNYSNIKLPDGVVLSVSGGVAIRITADNASELPLKPRIQPNTETVELGNGNFSAGEDFPAGVYDIVAVSGSGNVSSDNMYSGGLNALMGDKEANAGAALYEPEYKNIELPQGTTLEIDGVKIRLVPSK
jgi:hypothetical protein